MAKLPDAFLEKMKDLLGDSYDDYLKSFEAKRLYGLRVNTAKISVEDFLKRSPYALKPVPWTDNGFYYDGSEKPAKHPYYFAGLYYLQEPSAMTPARVLPVEPGDRILDVCAAPGGKSTELAARLNGTGILFSNDISNSRAQALLKNLELFGAADCVIMSEDPVRLSERMPEYFDKILIDAPCSGEGMFRKEPAVIKSWLEHGNAFYVSLQKQITREALKMLKPGGLMVYSTCTFSPDEDENMVLYMKSICPGLTVEDPGIRCPYFSEGMPSHAEYPDPDLKKCIRIFPHKADGEGHFVALLRKPGDPEKKHPAGLRPDCTIPSEADEFLKHLKLNRKGHHLELRNEKLSLIPDGLPELGKLRILRTGLYLGDVLKNRFEPSQALAMSLKHGDFDQTISFSADDPRVIRYLKGETLDISDQPAYRGYVLIEADGYPLGFGKASNGSLKNHYLKGWRYQ